MSAIESSSSASTFEWRKVCADAIASLKSIDLPDDLQIPSLPTALTEFLDASAGVDYEIPKLGQIIEHDPGMTVDLLKCVNVAAFGHMQPVKTPLEALIRLGVPKARNFLMAAGLRGATLAYESRLMNHRNFWNESIRRALFSQNAARNFKVDVDLAFIGGLLQDFVLPVLTNQYDDQYIQYLKNVAPQGISLTEWERDTFGWDHAAAGAFIAQKWNMPDDLLCAVLYHHRMDFALQAADAELFNLFPITLAALLPDQLCQVPGGVKKLVDADNRSTIFQLDELCEVVDREFEQIAEGHDRPLWLTPIIQQAREAMAADG
ncbi:MAG: HDOD domain-containing protein [Fuerstiella sp.]